MRMSVLFVPLLLAACGSGSQDAATAPTDGATPDAVASNVVLPPSIVASKTYRCRDNSLVFIEFLSDDRSANVSTSRDKPSVRVEAPAPGQPLVGGGWTVKAAKADVTVTVTPPGSTRPLSCRSGKA